MTATEGNEQKVETEYRVIRAGGLLRAYRKLLVPRPAMNVLRRIVEPLLGGARMERVRVLCPASGEFTDMFVDEMGVIKRLPFNSEATRIYLNNYLTMHPEADREGLPYIAGTAVVFMRPVCEDIRR